MWVPPRLNWGEPYNGDIWNAFSSYALVCARNKACKKFKLDNIVKLNDFYKKPTGRAHITPSAASPAQARCLGVKKKKRCVFLRFAPRGLIGPGLVLGGKSRNNVSKVCTKVWAQFVSHICTLRCRISSRHIAITGPGTRFRLGFGSVTRL